MAYIEHTYILAFLIKHCNVQRAGTACLAIRCLIRVRLSLWHSLCPSVSLSMSISVYPRWSVNVAALHLYVSVYVCLRLCTLERVCVYVRVRVASLRVCLCLWDCHKYSSTYVHDLSRSIGFTAVRPARIYKPDANKLFNVEDKLWLTNMFR